MFECSPGFWKYEYFNKLLFLKEAKTHSILMTQTTAQTQSWDLQGIHAGKLVR